MFKSTIYETSTSSKIQVIQKLNIDVRIFQTNDRWIWASEYLI